MATCTELYIDTLGGLDLGGSTCKNLAYFVVENLATLDVTLCSHVIIFVLPFPTAQTLACCLILSRLDCPNTVLYTVVKLLNKRWWIPIGVRPEVPKLEPEGPRAEMGFPTADQGFSSIQDTLFGFYGI